MMTRAMDNLEPILNRVLKEVNENFFRMMSTFLASMKEMFTDLTKMLLESVREVITTIGSSHASHQASPPTVALSSPSTSQSHDIAQAFLLLQEEQSEQKRRACNIIVTGLKPLAGTPDSELVSGFLSDHLHITTTVLATRRFGQGAKARLWVSLPDAADVNRIMGATVLLRGSNNPSTLDVFVNRDLTKQQADLAYKRRVRKRLEEGPGRDGPPQAGGSSGQPFLV